MQKVFDYKFLSIKPVFTADHIIVNGHKYDRLLIEKIIRLASDPSIKHIVIDCFAGLGGVTAGFSNVDGYMVIACLNHWKKAIQTHKANYPDCLHLEEDFKNADLAILQYMISEIKKRNPNVQVHVWWSFECTNFSNAKGGMSRDADSRTLADDADRYVIDLNPDVMWVENVREFMLWGPMIPKVVSHHIGKKGNLIKTNIFVPKAVDSEIDYYNLLIENGHVISCPLVVVKSKGKVKQPPTLHKWLVPDPDFKGQDYDRWRNYINRFGYHHQAKLLNCADYAVPQHRIRLIMKFVRSGQSITWPKPSHSKSGSNGLPKWLAVGPCLDLTNEGESILAFETDKTGALKIGKDGKPIPRITSAKTIDRAIKGCIKHRLKGEAAWIMKPNSAKNNTDVSSGSSIKDSSPAVTCFNGLNLATAHQIDNYFGKGFTKPITDPANTGGARDGASLQTFQFLSDYHSKSVSTELDESSKSLTTKDKYPLVTSHFIDHQFSSGQQNKGLHEPLGSLQGNPKQKLVQVEHLVMGTGYNDGSDRSFGIKETAKTITAGRKHYYILSTHWFNGSTKGIDEVANTVIARLDKTPTYLIVTEDGDLAIEVFDHDPPHYRKMKKFMAENKIVMVNMRMLEEEELLKIMTLDDHKLIASSTDNKKMIGNAVPKNLVVALAENHNEQMVTSYDLFNQKVA